MNTERLLEFVKDIERYAGDLRTVCIGYSMSLKQIADGIRELIEVEQKHIAGCESDNRQDRPPRNNG